MRFEYATRGVCARRITLDVENGVIKNVEFTGGCNGNLKAIAKLVEGKNASEISNLLIGNTCGMKNTSCADQLARAVLEAAKQEKNS